MTKERAIEILWDLISDLSYNEMEEFLNSSKRFVNVILDHTEKIGLKESI